MNSNDYYLRIGQIIKELREKQDLSKAKLAKGICSPSYISRIENGQRCPTSVILRQITNRLGITPDLLFRAIESPTAMELKEFINQLVMLIERDEYVKIYDLANKVEKENKIKITFTHDIQVVNAIKTIGFTIISKDYNKGLSNLNNILNLTYKKGTKPTEVEFAIMSMYGFILLLNNQVDEAYNHLTNIKKYVTNINIHSSLSILPKYYTFLAISCIDTGRYDEATKHIDYAITSCKNNNKHFVLRQLYYLKSEIYYYLGNKEESRKLLDKALALHDLIKGTDNEFFDSFVNYRLNKLKN